MAKSLVFGQQKKCTIILLYTAIISSSAALQAGKKGRLLLRGQRTTDLNSTAVTVPDTTHPFLGFVDCLQIIPQQP